MQRAVTTQFSVATFQDLGCGSAKKLITDYQNVQSTGGLLTGSAIVYISPLIINSQSLQSIDKLGKTSHSVGIFGDKSRGDAIFCLLSAPLLEDLHEWSHWSAIFQPQFGTISDFLLDLNSDSSTVTEVSALEVSPGKLLKIDRSSSIQAFNSAVDQLDSVEASGHLVSLIVLRGNSRDISPQLLSSHMTSVLERVKAEGASDSREEKNDRVGFLVQFILDCLLRIPLEICKLVAREVMLCHHVMDDKYLYTWLHIYYTRCFRKFSQFEFTVKLTF